MKIESKVTYSRFL